MLLLFLFVLLLFFVAFVTSEVLALRTWRGGWRVGALLPAVVLTAVAVRIVIDTAHDPTSHNLWPFEIVLWSAIGLVALGLLWLVRRISGGQRLSV